MNLLQMSFSGAVLILTIIVLRSIAINKLPKRIFTFLWELTLLRLLLPFSIPFSFSVYSLFRRSTPSNTLEKTPVTDLIPVMPAKQPAPVHEALTIPTEQPVSSLSVWFIIWVVGMILCIAFFAISYLRCRFEFQTALPVHNSFAKQWLRTHRLRRSISLKQSDRISTPLTYGILHPVILMPKKTDWENTEQLKYVLLHEYIHICRYDAVVKLISTLALCIHWFNPLVWVMYILFNRDIELACDESVVRRLGDASKSAYARTLINMEATKSGFTPLCNNFSKTAIEERITSIMKTKKLSILTLLTGTILVSIIAAACATSAPATQSTTNDTTADVAVSEAATDTAQASDIVDVIMPLYPLTSPEDALADGGYSVSFAASDLQKDDNGYNLTVEVFEYDQYSKEDIERLQVGAKIQFCNEFITVNSVEKSSDSKFITINGGFEEDGISLKEEDGLYGTISLDDFPVYYSVGQVALPVSGEVTFEDYSDLEANPDGEIFEGENSIESIKNSSIPFTCANTVITVRQGQIVQFIRQWTP